MVSSFLLLLVKTILAKCEVKCNYTHSEKKLPQIIQGRCSSIHQKPKILTGLSKKTKLDPHKAVYSVE